MSIEKTKSDMTAIRFIQKRIFKVITRSDFSNTFACNVSTSIC